MREWDLFHNRACPVQQNASAVTNRPIFAQIDRERELVLEGCKVMVRVGPEEVLRVYGLTAGWY